MITVMLCVPNTKEETVIDELSTRYDAAVKECSILHARVEEVERINLGLLTQLDDRSRDIASLRTQKDDLFDEVMTHINQIAIQRNDYKHAADAYKARLDQIQGIVNP